MTTVTHDDVRTLPTIKEPIRSANVLSHFIKADHTSSSTFAPYGAVVESENEVEVATCQRPLLVLVWTWGGG